MKRFIQHLRTKPEPVRKQILQTSIVVVGGLLVVAWVATLGSSEPKKENEPLFSKKELAPFQLIKQDFVETAHTVSTGIKSIKSNTMTETAE